MEVNFVKGTNVEYNNDMKDNKEIELDNSKYDNFDGFGDQTHPNAVDPKLCNVGVDLAKTSDINIHDRINIKIKKLNENAVIPTYSKDGDMCMDLTAIDYEYDIELDCFIYKTGLAVEVPKGYGMLLFPRSSNRKTQAYMCNHVGVLDSGYRGEIILCFKNRDISIRQCPYNVGDRVGQLLILPYPQINFIESEELSDSERGEGGFGHTGK